MTRITAPELYRFQQNRYPFLLVDVVTEYLPGEFAKGFKNLTNNEWFFPEHFPEKPNFPGALHVEAMAQMLTVALTTQEGMAGSVTRAVSYSVKFSREVVPGDRLDIEAKVVSWRRGLCVGHVRTFVNGEDAAEADVKIIIPAEFNRFRPPMPG